MPPHVFRGPLTAGPGPSENGHIEAIIDGPDPDGGLVRFSDPPLTGDFEADAALYALPEFERRRQLLAKLAAIPVGLTHRKTRRQQAIAALLAYLDDPDVVAAYRLAVNGEDAGT